DFYCQVWDSSSKYIF
nr:immunoglobulin light chain junction region [Macaca mulatta]MOX17508.1 immunoglobulin light chain junction region [Macaca mulatta]MOX17808.1 immunoglobulin light chain junction region [Macaca mulatta]MOX18165.1 immunoglobulin light chain junction region [Macaca mulatta]MOX18534.1 immunoglobulin light chain junction region [Macaca mulatta]